MIEADTVHRLASETPVAHPRPTQHAQVARPPHEDDVGHGQRKAPVYVQSLRHVGDAEMISWRVAVDEKRSAGGGEKAARDLEKRALPCAVRADDGEPLAAADGKRDVAKSQTSSVRDREIARLDGRGCWIVGRRPSGSCGPENPASSTLCLDHGVPDSAATIWSTSNRIRST